MNSMTVHLLYIMINDILKNTFNYEANIQQLAQLTATSLNITIYFTRVSIQVQFKIHKIYPKFSLTISLIVYVQLPTKKNLSQSKQSVFLRFCRNPIERVHVFTRARIVPLYFTPNKSIKT